MDSKAKASNLCPAQAKANREVVTTPLFKLYQTNQPSEEGLSEGCKPRANEKTIGSGFTSGVICSDLGPTQTQLLGSICCQRFRPILISVMKRFGRPGRRKVKLRSPVPPVRSRRANMASDREFLKIKCECGSRWAYDPSVSSRARRSRPCGYGLIQALIFLQFTSSLLCTICDPYTPNYDLF